MATFGLLLVIFGVVRSGRAAMAPFAIGAYITGAYWFTSSTSFANPAVTLARTLSDTFTGIAPVSVPGFVIAQFVGAGLAVGVARLLWPDIARVADVVVAPHHSEEGAWPLPPTVLNPIVPVFSTLRAKPDCSQDGVENCVSLVGSAGPVPQERRSASS